MSSTALTAAKFRLDRHGAGGVCRSSSTALLAEVVAEAAAKFRLDRHPT